jgi:glutathione S-transferase
MVLPILYSYRRCPYAMRARMALKYAGIEVEIREISLREKPVSMLQVSPKGTVPVLVLPEGTVLEQSLDIMQWALSQRDLDGWLSADETQMLDLIAENDGEFKCALDRYKYPARYTENVQGAYRAQGEMFLNKLEARLMQTNYLFKNTITLADIAIFPFVRQFAAVDSAWFERAPYPKLKAWLEGLVNSALFVSIMQKQPTFVDCF